ncbi:MAG: sigma-70 family RNA polymerase sigma factor [Armatimonadetes bacterium]|nr:sigma-70 family RNA polymerase sigma factor [Armatimonadota bacterium]MDE2207488.1 sigma-70 family RNA polymerase sigma factor [Armatimonadota bacterium]
MTAPDDVNSASGCFGSREFDVMAGALRPAMLRRARVRAGASDADDLVQTALMHAWQHRARYQPESGARGFSYWVMRILDAVCGDCIRARANRGEVLTDANEILALAEEAMDMRIDEDDLSEDCGSLRRLVEKTSLPLRQRQCISLWLSGLPQGEIAARFGVSKQAVSQKIAAAARRLRAARELGDDASPSAMRLFAIGSRVAIYRKPRRQYVAPKRRSAAA